MLELGYPLEAVGAIAIACGIALLAAALIDSKKPERVRTGVG